MKYIAFIIVIIIFIMLSIMIFMSFSYMIKSEVIILKSENLKLKDRNIELIAQLEDYRQLMYYCVKCYGNGILLKAIRDGYEPSEIEGRDLLNLEYYKMIEINPYFKKKLEERIK